MLKKIEDIFSTKKQRVKNQEKPKIIIDYREKNSLVASELIKLGFEIEFKELKVGDYIANNVVVERKTVQDFISSMINKRLIKQLEELQQYSQKIILIEGLEEQMIYQEDSNGVSANALRGFLLSIVLKWKVPVMITKNSEDSAKFISVLANKKEKQEISLNVSKKNLTKRERMQFILESFENIGPKTAKKLLEKNRTLKNIFNMPKEELKKEIGKKAETFKIFEEDY